MPAPAKPLSAIAAARLRAEASTPTIVGAKNVQDVVIQVPEAVLDSPAPLQDNSEEEDTEPTVAVQNLKLCNWRNNVQDILEDTTTQLTLNLNKHTTVAVVGCYRLKVLKGAINIKGANIAARPVEGSKGQSYTVFAPTTNPIIKIRGLDVTSHVQFTSITDYKVLLSISSSFDNIWAERKDRIDQRSFRIVCTVHSLYVCTRYVANHVCRSRIRIQIYLINHLFRRRPLKSGCELLRLVLLWQALLSSLDHRVLANRLSRKDSSIEYSLDRVRQHGQFQKYAT